MSKINLQDLTPEERKQLLQDAKELQKKEKATRKQNIVAYKELSEEYVNEHIDSLVHHHEITDVLIEKLWKGFKDIKELKAEIYGNKVNEQDSHTSTLKDGSASITIGYNTSIGFDGTETEGVAKIKDFINSLSSDDDKNRKLSAAVNTFLKPNGKTGMLNPSKIIELSKLKEDYNDERFDEGLEIIFNAQIKRQNSMYVEGWKFIKIDEKPKKIKFRFTI